MKLLTNSMAPIFIISVVLMSLKPLLLHLTRGVGHTPLAPIQFQLTAEVLKVLLCATAVGVQRIKGLPAPVWCGWAHTAAFAPPATVYLTMNLLTVWAARVLPPPVFQLVANMKILFTAVAAMLVMSQTLTRKQWMALASLTVGVMLGQWQGGNLEAPLSGVLVMLLNSFLSALAGVLTEKVMKANQSASLSIFATNIHMALHTVALNVPVLIAGYGVWYQFQYPSIADGVALLNEALNGIVISLLMRRIDSIAKNYAFSISVFVTAGISSVVLQYRPSTQFILGAILTLFSIWLYAHDTSSKVNTNNKKE